MGSAAAGLSTGKAHSDPTKVFSGRQLLQRAEGTAQSDEPGARSPAKAAGSRSAIKTGTGGSAFQVQSPGSVHEMHGR